MINMNIYWFHIKLRNANRTKHFSYSINRVTLFCSRRLNEPSMTLNVPWNAKIKTGFIESYNALNNKIYAETNCDVKILHN